MDITVIHDRFELGVMKRPQPLASVGVPHNHTGVIRSCDEQGRVRREVTGDDTALVAFQLPDQCVGPHAPQEDRLLASCGT